jgi:hypothetical protein
LLPQRVKMSETPREGERGLLRRVAAVVRSWDGPNSRIGLEMDLTQMPWGPFDALGKRLNLLLPTDPVAGTSASESEIERALRHVEHAADRCGEFARLQNGNQDLWFRSQETWEWVRRYLTAHWVDVEVDLRSAQGQEPVAVGSADGTSSAGPAAAPIPPLPGAAATLEAVARALRATPLSSWREAMGPSYRDAPTREEAIQTLLGVARILNGGGAERREDPPHPESRSEPAVIPGEEPGPAVSRNEEPDPDPDQVSFDLAKGYDEGYQMGRKVGLALGAHRGARRGKA